MTGELARLFVSLFGDTSNLDKTLTDSQKKLQQVSKNMNAIGKKMTTFVTLPLVGIGVAALKVASDAEEMESKFNVVFGELAGETKTWSDSFGDSIGRSTSSVMGWMAALQDTFVPLGFAREKGAEMSKTLAELTVDMASFNNESEANVIRDLQSALVGNHETVRKYGVIITQATLNQELMNMGIEGGIKEATEQEKVLARMNIILKGTSDAQGDAARTADSFANRMRALKESGKDVLINIGQQLIPVISQLVEKINQAVDWFNNLDERQQKLIITIAGVLAVAGPLLLGIGKMIPLIQSLIPVVYAVNAAFAANPILAVVAAAALLATGAILLIKNWDKVKVFLIGLWDKFRELWDKVPDWMKILMPFVTLPMLIIENWDQIKEFMINLVDVIKRELVDRFLGIVESIREGVEKVTGFFKDMFDKVAGESYVTEMVNRIEADFTRMSDIMRSKAEEAAEGTKTIFGHLADYMEEDFEQSFVSTMEAVWTSTGNIATKIKDTVKGLIADVLRGFGLKYAALAAGVWFLPWQALKYAAAAAAFFAASAAVRRLAQGGLVVGETFAQLGEGREREAVLPLNQNVYGELAEGIINKLSEMQTAWQPGLPPAPIPTMGARPVHLHIGTFIGDDLSLKKLERRLRDIRIIEDQRLGVGA